MTKPVWLGLLLFTLLSYFQYPGHVYLESDTQIYLPMFERFEDPGRFARDPMVTRAHTAFTLYDELALTLRRLTGQDYELLLGALQALGRLALLAGVFLITRAMGLSETLALVCAGVYGLGGRVNGPALLLVEYEPVPRALALGPVLLGVGLAAQRRYLAAGIAGAAGFLLHPATAAPFWAVFAVLLFVPDEPEEMKARLWGLLPLAAALAALKAGAARQPGVSELQALWGRIDPAWEELIRLRASYVLVSEWSPVLYWQYIAMGALVAAAWWRLRQFLQPNLRFFLAGLGALGLLSLPVSWLLMEKLKWALLPQLQPARAILMLQAFTLLAALVMAFELACREKRWLAAGCWAAAGWSAGLEPRLLLALAPAAVGALLHRRLQATGLAAAVLIAWSKPFGLVFWKASLGRDLLIALALGALLVAAAAVSLRRPVAGALAATTVVAGAYYLIPGELRLRLSGQRPNPELAELSRWARAETEPSAVFLFADAGRRLEPGVFRARAGRALYVDWKGGGQINFFREYSRLWWTRWRQTMAEPFHSDRVPALSALGIDYLVLTPKNRLPDGQPVWENSRYLAYRLPSARQSP